MLRLFVHIYNDFNKKKENQLFNGKKKGSSFYFVSEI